MNAWSCGFPSVKEISVAGYSKALFLLSVLAVETTPRPVR
jgi:hypothetical protein